MKNLLKNHGFKSDVIYLVDHMKIQKLHENTKIYLQTFTLYS